MVERTHGVHVRLVYGFLASEVANLIGNMKA